MPFDTPQASPAPTRRSSRRPTAPADAAAGTASPIQAEVAAATAAIAVPLSRRAARRRLHPSGEPENTLENAAEAPESSVTVEAPVPAEAEATAYETPKAAAPEPADEDASEPEIADEQPTDEQPADESSADPFEQASRAFRAAQRRTPQPAASDDDADTSSASAPAAEKPAHDVATRRPRLRKLVAVGASVGVMSLAGLLAVSMTVPAEALAATQGGQTAMTSLVAGDSKKKDAAEEEIQAFVAPSDVQNESLVRAEDYSTVSLVDIAAEQGIHYSSEVFTNDPEAAIQWPFKVGVAMSSGYGMRWGRLHEGIDFVPGEGAPIQAIADGTVRIATEQGGAYGVTVYIDHVIDGQVVTSHYAHMQYGSLQVKPGQTVKVGDIVGKTGNTGRSYGAHLHFEIIINGSTIDPLPWLRENAGRYSY